MIIPGQSTHDYEVILNGELLIGEMIQSMSMSESLDEIAVRVTMDAYIPDDGTLIIDSGMDIQIIGYPFDSRSARVPIFEPGVVWSTSSRRIGSKVMQVVCYDRTIHLAKSEDEILFPAGQTATQRLETICGAWGIPMVNVPDTEVPLAKALRRGSKLHEMIMSDLTETAMKGGKMFRPRVTAEGLTLVEIGSNTDVWILDNESGVTEIGQTQTLEGAITRVKVLGKQEDENLSPVLAVESSDKIDVFGLMQKVVYDEKAADASEASSIAKAHLAGLMETFTTEGIDINTVRAGDKVIVGEYEQIVMTVGRRLGDPGTMTLQLGTPEIVRRRYYTDV